MAEETAGFLIDVQTTAQQALDELGQLPAGVDRIAGQISQALEKLSTVDPFNGVVAGADLAGKSIEELIGLAASVRTTLLSLSSAGAELTALGAPVTSTTALTEQLRAQNALINEQIAATRELLALQQQASERRAGIANGTIIPARPALGEEPSAERLAAERQFPILQTARTLNLPGDEDVLVAEQQQAQAAAAVRQAEATRAATSRRNVVDANAAVNTAGVALDPIADFTAIQTAMEEGLVSFRSKTILEVRETFAGINGAIQPGFYNTATGARSTGLDEAYLSSTSPSFNGSGGGFGSGFKSGFFGGFGGSGGSDNGLADIGQQAGFIAKYVLLYQVFRDIEESIKRSIELTLNFDRSVTDVANQLGLSRDNANGLANNLANIGAQSGLNPASSVALGLQFATTFRNQPGAPSASDLAAQGTATGGELHVLGGGTEEQTVQNLRDLSAVVLAFNLDVGDTNRVLDAATSAAQNFGLGSANNVLPGLAQIGDLAQQAGFSVEFMANALADIQARTGQTSAAAAGELQRFLGREGNASFQQVFTSLGINTNQNFSDELEQLSDQYSKLTQQQKAFIIGEFGGGRAGVDALAFIEQYHDILDQTSKTLDSGGISQEQYYKRLDDVRGIITQLRGEFDLLLKDIGTSGVGTGVGVLLDSLTPVLRTVDDILGTFDKIPEPIREAAFLAAELAGALKLAAAANLGTALLGRTAGLRSAGATEVGLRSEDAYLIGSGGLLGGLGGRAVGGARGFLGGFVGGYRGTATGDVESATVDKLSGAASAASAALDKVTGSAEKAAAATGGEAVASEADAAAKIEDATATTVNALGGLAGVGAEAGAALRGLINPVTVLIAGIIGIDQAYRATQRIDTGVANAQSQLEIGTLPGQDDLQSRANALRNAAAAARHSSGGLFGTVENFVRGNPTGQASDADLAEAQLLDYERKQAQAAQNAGSSTNNLAESMVNLSSTGDGLTQSLTAMTNAGFTAQQQIDAIFQKFNDNNLAGQHVIPAGQLQAVSTGAGASVANARQTYLQTEFQSVGVTPKINPQAFASLGNSVTKTVQDYFTSLGLSEGQQASLTPTQLQGEKQAILTTLVDNMKKDGASALAIARALPELNLEAAKALNDQYRAITGGTATLNSADVINIVKQVQTLAQQAGQDAAAVATLTGTAGGGQLAGAQAQVATLQRVLSLVQGSNLDATDKANDVNYISGLIQDAQVTVQQAAIANVQALAALATSVVSPFDKSGQLKSQLQGLQQQLAVTTDATQKKALGAQINQLRFQQSQQVVDDANAATNARVNYDDATGKAKAGYSDALRQYNLIVSEGVTSGADYSNAVQALNDARQQYIDAQVSQLQAQATGSARAGDPLSAASTQLQNAQLALANDTAGTTKYYTDLAAVHQAEAELAQQIAAGASASYLLGNDTTDPVAQARAALLAARTQLNEDTSLGTGSLSNDKLAVENAQQAAQKAKFDQRLSDQQTAYQLNEESAAQYLNFLDKQHDTLQRQLAGMRKGTEGYRQAVDELNSIDQAIQAVDGSLSGQFNLGNIKVPTVYQVRESLAPGGTLGAASAQDVTVTVVDKTEGGVKAKAVLADALGSSTVGRTAITPRKVRR